MFGENVLYILHLYCVRFQKFKQNRVRRKHNLKYYIERAIYIIKNNCVTL